MRLGYVIIYVPDVAATAAFFERAFGLKARFIHESGYAEVETGATALAFAAEALASKSVPEFAANRRDSAPAGAEIGLVVEDVPAAFQRAVSAGCTPVLAPVQKPWGQTVSYVRDLNGFLVEICSAAG